MLNDMEEWREIKEFDSPWSSPVVIVRKKNAGIRFFVDYMKLNGTTKKDYFTLSRIDKLLDKLTGAKWLSTLDLTSGC
jgi:hypothetical protein